MSKQIIIAEQHRIAAVFEADQIQELVVATGTHQVSDIYLGVVENVLPGIDAAFVNIGDSDRNGFIHVTDLGPLRLRRSGGSITELLAPQQKVLVQVMKEPTGTKGPRLTGNVSLPGRYLVLMPNGRGVNLSRRISSENERNRLRALAILMKPAGMGVVIRTEAEGIPEEAIIEDLENLQKQWESVLQEASSTRAPALLNRDDDFVQRVLRDTYCNEVNRIVVDSAQGMKRVKQHLTSWSGGRMPLGILVDQHNERSSILEYFRVNAAIREAMKPRVDLPSGGYIIIEKTEALTVIDVNSGSFTRSATARETVLWTNCESATEIARQLRLRNIAGVIIVDFIDMESRRDQLQVLEHFNQAMQTDKAKPQIAQLTELGLVELTRKRQGKNIYELFGSPCPSCNGLGIHTHLPGEAPSALQVNHQYHHYEEIPDHFAPAPQAAIGNYGEGSSRDGSREVNRESRGRVSRETRNPRDTSKRPEARSVPRDAYAAPESYGLPEAGAYEGDSDTDLELLHHPSYQERQRNGGGNRRRRRRDAPFDREATPTASSTATPWSEESDRPSRYVPSIPTREPEPVHRFIEEEEEEEEEERVITPEVREPRDDRRSRGRRDRFPSEPPEVIHVEMSSEEQDVYAWMGISPLVMSSQTPKNPRSAVISVHLPGEAPEDPIEATFEPIVNGVLNEQPEFDLKAVEYPTAESFAGRSLDEDEDDFSAAATRIRRTRASGVVSPPVKKVIGMSSRSDEYDPDPVLAFEPFQVKSMTAEPVVRASVPMDDSDGDLDENGAPRRRRRRSSAT